MNEFLRFRNELVPKIKIMHACHHENIHPSLNSISCHRNFDQIQRIFICLAQTSIIFTISTVISLHKLLNEASTKLQTSTYIFIYRCFFICLNLSRCNTWRYKGGFDWTTNSYSFLTQWLSNCLRNELRRKITIMLG